MNIQSPELKLETSRVIKASKEALFDAWLNPETLAKFMTPGENMTVPECTADAREGGRFRIVMRAGDQDLPHGGTYKVINRPNQLAFTWESPFSTSEDSTVTIDFTDTDGGTNVTLTHVRFPSEEMRDNHNKGWTEILAALETAV